MKERMKMYKILDMGEATSLGEGRAVSGVRAALLKDGRYITIINTTSGGVTNDFTPLVAYSDDGIHYGECKPLFPEYIGKKSIYVSVRNTEDGGISICGFSINIDKEGEEWWDDPHCAIKENQLVYTLSDDGYHIPPLKFLDLPYYGAAEIPGGMQVDKDGTMTIVYSPYSVIEAKEATDTNCLVRMISQDGGETWESSKIACVEGKSLYAETWIVTLPDGARLVSTWQTANETAPDQYLYAKDGVTFGNVAPLPFKGQSTSLLALKDGRVLIPYNQRKEEPIGVWMAVTKPNENGLNMTENAPVWNTESGNKTGDDTSFSGWTTFSFGEPQVIERPDGTFLLILWFSKGDIGGGRYIHFAIE